MNGTYVSLSRRGYLNGALVETQAQIAIQKFQQFCAYEVATPASRAL